MVRVVPLEMPCKNCGFWSDRGVIRVKTDAVVVGRLSVESSARLRIDCLPIFMLTTLRASAAGAAAWEIDYRDVVQRDIS